MMANSLTRRRNQASSNNNSSNQRGDDDSRRRTANATDGRKKREWHADVVNDFTQQLLAAKLPKQDGGVRTRSQVNADLRERENLMTESIEVEGKAVLAVQEIIDLAKANSADIITQDDMVFFTENMLRLQQEYVSKGINGHIDVGYHYTSSEHIANIRQHGLLTRSDRNSQQLNATFHGSIFGDGIYTANNPDSFSGFGNTGVLVARLPGEIVRVRGSLPYFTMVDSNTIVGDKMKVITSQQMDTDNWPLNNDNHEIVLRSSAQCVPMIKYDARSRKTRKGKECIKNMEKGLQDIFDKYFNAGLQRSEYRDAEILLSNWVPRAPQVIVGTKFTLLTALIVSCIMFGVEIAMRISDYDYDPVAMACCHITTLSVALIALAADDTLSYKAPKSLTTGIPSDAMSTPDSSCDMKEDCVICCGPLENWNKCTKLKCGHIFHKECIQRAFQSKPQCPVCRKSIGAPVGKCPSGTMTTTTSSMRCSGFREGSIVITYVIPAGKQMSYHDNPGSRHASKHTTAYIPNNPDGQALLKRLKYAFLHGLTFTVGTSVTTGRQNQCTWASIHHKTSPSGGVQFHGFPDPDYFNNCNAELDGLGVPPVHSLDENGKEV